MMSFDQKTKQNNNNNKTQTERTGLNEENLEPICCFFDQIEKKSVMDSNQQMNK